MIGIKGSWKWRERVRETWVHGKQMRKKTAIMWNITEKCEIYEMVVRVSTNAL